MDRIRIEGIELHGFHGVPAAEREVGHRYRIDAVLELDLLPAARSDEVEATVDYGEVAREIIAVGTGPSVKLVETLAHRMADRVLERFPQIQAVNWYGLLAPAGTPRPIIDRLHAEVVKVMAESQTRERLRAQGGEPDSRAPAEFAEFMRAEHARWGKVIREANIRAE